MTRAGFLQISIFCLLLVQCGPDTFQFQLAGKSPAALHRQFSFKPVKPVYAGNYEGHYSAYLKEGEKILHGEFNLQATSPAGRNSESIEYRGLFYHGKKEKLQQSYQLSDTHGLSYQWKASISFSGEKCSRGIFEGKIGKDMPSISFKTKQLQPCTLPALVDKAYAGFNSRK